MQLLGMYKFRNWILLLFLAAVPFAVSSQNLVRNGSFEQDDCWDNFLDTFSVPSSNIRNYFEFYIKTLRNVSDWTDSASTWTININENGVPNYNYDSAKYRPKQWGPIDSMYLYKELYLHPWFIDDRVFTDNFRDSVFHKTPIGYTFPDDYTREVLPYYPNKALHGHKYIYLTTALNEIDDISNNHFYCINYVSNYAKYSYFIPWEEQKCRGCPVPRTYIPSFSQTNDIVSNKLTSPTKKGKKYKIGFFASVANNYIDSAMIDSLSANPIKIEISHNFATLDIWTLPYLYFRKRQGNYRTYASDALGVLLTKREPVAFIPGEGEFFADSSNIPSDRISLESTSQQFRIPKPLMNHAEWEEFSWEFTADDEYTYLNIGNFWKRSQLNFIRWKFHLIDLAPSVYCPPSGIIDYVYHDIGYFIDSVYLIPLGPKIAPYQKNACIGDTVHIQDINKKEVAWILEDGSISLSDRLSIVISKPVTRIIAEAVGEYDTIY
ncbi:MAG: hypothetical protein LC101_11430, partial [Flavobacteriales bacterium]|nr:hypothetical protein [Flavobacteriales bacterium]